MSCHANTEKIAQTSLCSRSVLIFDAFNIFGSKTDDSTLLILFLVRGRVDLFCRGMQNVECL